LNRYTIRHTFASCLAIKGTPIHTIQELLGHKDLRMTLRYAHLSPAHLAEAVETVEAAEKPNRLHAGCPPKESGDAETEAKPFESNGSPNGSELEPARAVSPRRRGSAKGIGVSDEYLRGALLVRSEERAGL